MNHLTRQLIMVTAGAALSLTTSQTRLVQAALITYDFDVNIDSGPLRGKLYKGSFSYDDFLLTGTGEEIVTPEDGLSVNFSFTDKDITLDSDFLDFSNAYLKLYNGNVLASGAGLYWIAEGDFGKGVNRFYIASIPGRTEPEVPGRDFFYSGISPKGKPYGTTSLESINYSLRGEEPRLPTSSIGKVEDARLSRVTDINPGSQSANPFSLTQFKDALYFHAQNEAIGNGLWKYDGTTTSLAADIPSEISRVSLSVLTPFDNALYFSADNGVNGQELWKYDGSTVSLVADINPGKFGSSLFGLTTFKDTLYFNARDDMYRVRMWQYDGTTVSPVANINPEFTVFLDDSIVFNDALYFPLYGEIGTRSRGGLGRYDGTSVSLVANINPASSENPAIRQLAVFNDAIYFTANDGVYGQELWKYDGNTASLVADINPRIRSSFISSFAVFEDALYFSAIDKTGIRKLWRYDGNTVSSVTNRNLGRDYSYFGGLTTFDNALYFVAGDKANGAELWKLESEKSTSVPEPATVLSLITFGASSFLLKRKYCKAT